MKRWVQRKGEDLHEVTEAIDFLRKVEPESFPIEITVRPYKHSRTAEQNRLYWAIVTEISARMPSHMDGIWHSPKVWHEFFKQMMLGLSPVDVGGVDVVVTKSTRDLTTSEFTDFISKVEAWAADQGVWMDMR